MKKHLIILLAALVISNFSFGQNLVTKIDSIVKDNYKKHPEVSISVGYIHNNKEQYINYGKISKESSMNVNEYTVFEIASITKAITGNLIAQAVNEGKIKLNGYIENYLPKDFIIQKQLRRKITISDLASHQSGLADLDWKKLISKNPQDPLKNVNRKTFIDIINNCSELPDYGTYRYHTTGFMLLGEILEEAYGKSYDEIVREKLINPIKMKNTLTKEFNIKNIATGYNRNGIKQNLMLWNSGAPSGLIKSSSKDMIKYLKEILNDSSEISKAGIMTEKIFYKAKKGPRKIGLGINIYNNETNTFFQKTGDTMGQSSILCYNRKDNWGIIILINQQNPKMRKELWNKIYETTLK
ncbi:CubicO group peptidase, beta-lactamase class C family [Aquimarina amphilecti]|uniref:CubicO group peptidase, beta-lactamase class C family n=1 Tax=Aquimarina amphilecti TaxID=1038014 RepID=A0A1H7QYR1_AQUAM|nr:serine hydrolase domain-containing protein [Aquimarina amphilecti]SEL53073.1 CubicO group peptidase, beta-lactamase class C family [Aquimarina amphilecti]